jgi:tryptophan-rich sensory protein
MSGNKLSLAVFIGICLAVELISGRFTASSVGTWYVGLNKPTWTPPGWVFGPVWTALYISMGVAAWIVWRERSSSFAHAALWMFGLQLALNGLWSFVFFGLRQPGWGLVDIGLLWASLAATTFLFFRVNSTAGLLLVPYLLWVSFASMLNYSIWRMNS